MEIVVFVLASSTSGVFVRCERLRDVTCLVFWCFLLLESVLLWRKKRSYCEFFKAGGWMANQ